MNHKVRNIAFMLVVALVMSAPVATKCLDKAGVPFPEFMKIGTERSYLEGRAYENLPLFSLSSVFEGEFQDNFEQFAADLIPMRDNVLMANASVQRLGIQTASLAFGYDVYPTYYGSDYAYVTNQDAVVETLHKASTEEAESFQLAADSFNQFVNRNSEYDYAFYVVDRVSSSSNNPTHDLVKNSLDTDFLDENFFNLLDESIVKIDGRFNTSQELQEALFRTDHHWEIDAAYTAYERIVEHFDAKSSHQEKPYGIIEYNNIPFYGSLSRSGLCLSAKADSVTDYWIEFDSLEVKIDENSGTIDSLAHKSMYESNMQNSDLYTNRYAEYFHSDFGLIHLSNENAASSDTLLIVGDSFTNNMERFFAQNYQDVLCFDPRYSEESIEDVLARYNVDDIVFILGSTNIASQRSLNALA